MAITFNKKRFKKSAKQIKLGKKKYALRTTFIMSLFYAGFISFFYALIHKDSFSWKEFLLFTIPFCIFHFILYYFQISKQWKSIISEYNETIDYWEKHDPSFFDGVIYEKLEEVKKVKI